MRRIEKGKEKKIMKGTDKIEKKMVANETKKEGNEV